MDQDDTHYGGRPPPKRHCVRWGTQLPRKKGTVPHVYCGRTAGWIKMPLGTTVGLGPGHIVRWGPISPLQKGGTAPNFRPLSIVAKRSPISATAEHLYSNNATNRHHLISHMTACFPTTYMDRVVTTDYCDITPWACSSVLRYNVTLFYYFALQPSLKAFNKAF